MKKGLKHLIALTLALIMMLSVMTGMASAATTGFSDVKTTDWFYTDVMACAEQNIVSGFEDGTFRPNSSVTNIQLLTMLTRTFYADKVNAVNTTGDRPWYYPYVKTAEDILMSTGMKAVDDNPIDRYEMALVLTNTLAINGLTITLEAQSETAKQIADYNKIPVSYQRPVAICYNLGIITGMSDGSFAGNQNMTRAQACTVIMRMMKTINSKSNSAPGTTEPTVKPDKPTTPSQESAQTSGKLANGKDATTENVLEILEEIKQEYPTGTIWGEPNMPGNHYYAKGRNDSDAGKIICQFKCAKTGNLHGNIASTRYACSGWACMVSDRIFGQTGAPAREVTDGSKVRAGDIIIAFDKDGGLLHVAIASGNAQPKTGLSGATHYGFTTCGGNVNGGYVSWNYNSYAYISTSSDGGYRRAWTRYPTDQDDASVQQPASQPAAPVTTPATNPATQPSNSTMTSPVNTSSVPDALNQLKQKYPTGTTWNTTTVNYAAGSNSVDVKAILDNLVNTDSEYGIDTTAGCGGWAAMVSDYLFGQSGAPAHEVTNPSAVRAGDIIVAFNSKGQAHHVAIASENAHAIPTLSGGVAYGFTTCDGDGNDSEVNWWNSYVYLKADTIRAWTRYPD